MVLLPIIQSVVVRHFALVLHCLYGLDTRRRKRYLYLSMAAESRKRICEYSRSQFNKLYARSNFTKHIVPENSFRRSLRKQYQYSNYNYHQSCNKYRRSFQYYSMRRNQCDFYSCCGRNQFDISMAGKSRTGTFSNVTNGAQYTGVKTATLTVLAPPFGFNGYQFRCLVSGNCSPPTVTSNPATLTVNQVASISIQPSNVSSCQGSTVSFSVTASGTGLTYQWYEKVGAGAFLPTTDGGIYSGSLTSTLTLTGISTSMNNNQYMVVIGQATCPVSSAIASLTVNGQPTLLVTNPAPVCAPSTVDITAASVTAGSNLAGGTLSYWQDAATTVPLSNPNAISTSGTYYIRVGTSPVCYAVSPVVVTINTLPAATISYTGGPFCPTGTATVTQTGTAGGTYSAPAGVSINAATGSINLASSAVGTYTITYSFTNGTCANTATTSITINALPFATITYTSSPYCASGTANVTRTGTAGGTYTAPAGVSINSSTGAINLASSTPGTYTVTYSFSNGVCNGTTITSITITALPTATIAYAGSPYCATGIATVTQTGTAGGTYSAPAGVVINAATGDINLVTSTPGTYTITYSFTVGACSNTATTSITITALPTATIAYCWITILCNWYGDCYSDWHSGRYIHSACRSIYYCDDWCD